jgi:hypothetical protein
MEFLVEFLYVKVHLFMFSTQLYLQVNECVCVVHSPSPVCMCCPQSITCAVSVCGDCSPRLIPVYTTHF